jgi:hypothetical protein
MLFGTIYYQDVKILQELRRANVKLRHSGRDSSVRTVDRTDGQPVTAYRNYHRSFLCADDFLYGLWLSYDEEAYVLDVCINNTSNIFGCQAGMYFIGDDYILYSRRYKLLKSKR